MRVAVLSSGSKANCTYIEHNGQALLIDCGLSAKQAQIRLQELGLDASQIRAILITHEHSDHIKGISVLSRKLEVPVYANKPTSKFLKNIHALELFDTGREFEIENFVINPFSLVHDAADPVGFTVTAEGIKMSQLTDLGRITNLVRHAVQDSNFLVLESNYDQEMLKNCEYPWQLKQRINSVHGHLSNDDAAVFLSEIKNDQLKHVILGHLSENSNLPELALETAEKFNDFNEFDTLECGSVQHSSSLMSL